MSANVIEFPRNAAPKGGRPRGVRLSVEPLLAALTRHGIDPQADLEGRLATSLRQAEYRGYVTLAVGDEIACDYLHLHPIQVWGQEYEDAAWFDMHDTDELAESAIAIPLAVAA